MALQSGEIVCLLGASGSGKTTLLQILSGQIPQDSGTVTSPVTRPGSELGYMRQSDQLLPWRSILDNVALGPELLGQSRRVARAAALEGLARVGLQDFAAHMPDEISGGMRQRAVLARTLATKPKLLFLDEPLSNLDVLARRQTALIVKDYVTQTGAAALVVTHSVEEACFLSDRILVLSSRPARVACQLAAPFALDQVMAALMQALEEEVTT